METFLLILRLALVVAAFVICVVTLVFARRAKKASEQAFAAHASLMETAERLNTLLREQYGIDPNDPNNNKEA